MARGKKQLIVKYHNRSWSQLWKLLNKKPQQPKPSADAIELNIDPLAALTRWENSVNPRPAPNSSPTHSWNLTTEYISDTDESYEEPEGVQSGLNEANRLIAERLQHLE